MKKATLENLQALLEDLSKSVDQNEGKNFELMAQSISDKITLADLKLDPVIVHWESDSNHFTFYGESSPIREKSKDGKKSKHKISYAAYSYMAAKEFATVQFLN